MTYDMAMRTTFKEPVVSYLDIKIVSISIKIIA